VAPGQDGQTLPDKAYCSRGANNLSFFLLGGEFDQVEAIGHASPLRVASIPGELVHPGASGSLPPRSQTPPAKRMHGNLDLRGLGQRVGQQQRTSRPLAW